MSELLLGQPLHHLSALELVCAAEKCDAWAEIRADVDGQICYYVDSPELKPSGWWWQDGETPEERGGVVIGSLQMFGEGEDVDWRTWGILQSDWRWIHIDPPLAERDFRGYMRRVMPWAKIVRCFKVAGELVLVAGEEWLDGHFLGRSQTIDGWAELLKMNEYEGWGEWQMEL